MIIASRHWISCLAATSVPPLNTPGEYKKFDGNSVTGHNAMFDGNNLLGAISESSPSPTHLQPMFWKWQDDKAVLAGKWKYVLTSDYTVRTTTSQLIKGPVEGKMERLFDLSTDPSEQVNLIEANQEIADSLRQMHHNWEMDLTK